MAVLLMFNSYTQYTLQQITEALDTTQEILVQVVITTLDLRPSANIEWTSPQNLYLCS